MCRACSPNGEKEMYIRGFGGGGPEKKFGIPRLRWEDNIKVDLQVTEWKCELD